MDGSGRARRVAVAAVALAAALVAAVALVPAAGAGERAFGATQVGCPRDAGRDLPESSRIACWAVEPGTVLPALRRSDETGERLRIDLLRRVHVVVRMTYDEGSDGWITAGEPPAGLIVGDDGAISNGTVWVGGQVYELRRLDRRTYVVGQVYRYAAKHADEPTPPPMTSPTVVERPPAPPRTGPPRTAPTPSTPPARAASPAAAPPARSAATPSARRTATPRPSAPATPPAVAATPSPATVAVPAPAGRSRLPLVALAAAALAAVGLAAARARRGGGSARPGQP